MDSDSTERIRDFPSKSAQLKLRSGGLGPAYAIVQAMAGSRFPRGELGFANVPESLMAPVTDYLIRRYTHHVEDGRCHNKHCRHVPNGLRRYRSMRPQALRAHLSDIHKVLWLEPDHEMVLDLRKTIVEKDAETVASLRDGRLLDTSNLEAYLADRAHGLHRLAAVLWALRFEVPGGEDLFRCLCAMSQDPPVNPQNNVQSERPERVITKRLRQLKKNFVESKAAMEQARKDKDAANRIAERARREHEEGRILLSSVTDERNALRDTVDDLTSRLYNETRKVEKLSAVKDAMRKDVQRLQREVWRLETAAGESATQMAHDSRRIATLETKLDALKGSLSMWNFIKSEEKEIDTAILISQGGPKVEAKERLSKNHKLEKAFLEAYPEYVRPRPAVLRAKRPITFSALGGLAEIGRSCYVLGVGKYRVVVDCGIKPSSDTDIFPNIESLDHVDAVLLTHAHADHIGWLPALYRRFPETPLFCSGATAALLPIMLRDSQNNYLRKLARRRQQATRILNIGSLSEAYDDDDLNLVSKRAVECAFGTQEPLLGDLSLRLFPAGHIAGAASALLEDQSGVRIFVSGDFSSTDQLTVPAAAWPNDIEDIDLLILESTYGLTEHHESAEEARDKFIRFLSETLSEGGTVIVAAFALGRAQELLSVIGRARREGRMPLAPVYVDGLIRSVNPIYRKLAVLDFPDAELNTVTGGNDERRQVIHQAERNPSIIVTTSGMMTGGPVLEYAKHLLPNSRNRIVFVGYQDEGAPSKALIGLQARGGGRVRIQDEEGEESFIDAAAPAKEIKLSAHADRAGLVDYARLISPRNVVLVHGEENAQKELAARLEFLHGMHVEHGQADLTIV